MSYKIEQYIKDNHIKLTKKEKDVLELDVEKNADKIIKSYLPLIFKITTKRCNHKNESFDDYFANSLLAASKAVSKFNKNKGSFYSFMYSTILFELSNYYNSAATSMIRKPFSNRHNLIVPVAVSYDSFSKSDSDYKYIDTVAESVEEKIEVDFSKLKLILSDKYQFILFSKYGVNGYPLLTADKIAEKYNTSKEVINNTCCQIVNKIKKHDGLMEYLLKQMQN